MWEKRVFRSITQRGTQELGRKFSKTWLAQLFCRFVGCKEVRISSSGGMKGMVRRKCCQVHNSRKSSAGNVFQFHMLPQTQTQTQRPQFFVAKDDGLTSSSATLVCPMRALGWEVFACLLLILAGESYSTSWPKLVPLFCIIV